MQVILKPVTHDELGEIIVKDDLFPIGRYETPFSEYDSRYVEKLSRRHARIFEQDGVVYIADLGSLNGTALNGTSVDTMPMRLKRGDEICFTDSLCYHIDILGVSAERVSGEAPGPLVQLVLKPRKQPSLLEPIVVTRFPFLIKKGSDVFSRYKDSLPDDINYISRRHAHLFLKGKDVYVEDLGSTNGTFVSGTPLEEHARKLQDGDVIAFGGETFAYTVCMYSAEEDGADTLKEGSELLDSTAHSIDDVARTTFVSSANSFLDIFCTEGEHGDGGQHDEEAAADSGKTATGKESGSGGGFFHRLRVTLGAVRDAFVDKEKDRRGFGRVWLVVAALAGIAILIAYFSDWSTREVSDLLEQDAYELAAVKANRFLETHPGDEKITALATEAALRQVVPDWVGYVNAGNFPDAESAVEQGIRLSYANPQAQQLFDVLAWGTRLEKFIADRGGPDTPVTIFEEEDRINELVAWWETDPKGRRRSLGKISRFVPEFMESRQQIFSHLRAVQNQQSLSVAAIDRLAEQVRDALDNANAQALPEILSDFESRYPRIRGVEVLYRDLEVYLPLELDLQERNWVRARQTVDRTGFETPVFQDRVRFLVMEQLPVDAIMERYKQALADWQRGDTESALAELEELAGENWGEVADRRLQHMRQVMSDFKQLNHAKDSHDYDRQLLGFYRALDPVEDVYFSEAVAEEFQMHRNKALQDAARHFKIAGETWKEYLAGGGIRGLHRLEDSVTATYRKLATQLSAAYDAMSKTMDIHRLLKTDTDPGRDELYASISNEVKLQRQSLDELQMVLEPSLRTAKLGLLPVPQAGLQGTADDRQMGQ